MEAELVENANIAQNSGIQRASDGKFLPGSGGRPMGAKNKFTLVKEALVDAFHDIDTAEAFKNTLVYDDLLPGADGKKKKKVNLEALRCVLRVLPREDQGIGNTYNFNLVVAELKTLGPADLRAIIAAGKASIDVGGTEGAGPA